MRWCVLIALVASVLFPVARSAEPMALSSVRTICVEQLGDDNEAAVAREQLIAALSKIGRFTVKEPGTACDAHLVGRVSVTIGQQGYVWSGNVFGSQQTRGGSAPVRLVTFAGRLVSEDKSTLWAYDSAKDLKGLGFTKSLSKAVEDEEKRSKKK